jgi:hypothetical protein
MSVMSLINVLKGYLSFFFSIIKILRCVNSAVQFSVSHTHTHTRARMHTVVQEHLPYSPPRNRNLTVHCLQDCQKATAMPVHDSCLGV